MADITLKKRASILTLFEHCQASTKDIAKLYNVGQSTVAQIIRQLKETESLTSKRKRNCGRKRKTIQKMMRTF